MVQKIKNRGKIFPRFKYKIFIKYDERDWIDGDYKKNSNER